MTTLTHAGRASGVTLIELIVALAIMGLMAAVSALAFRGAREWQPPERFGAATAALVAARRDAIRSGHPVTIVVAADSGAALETAFPDGRVSASGGDLDPLSGRPPDAR